jgi:ribosomal protein L11 methylase PrmA
LASGLAQTVAAGGILILGGILAEQEPEVCAALHATGMELLSTKKASAKDSGAGSWVALIARAQ